MQNERQYWDRHAKNYDRSMALLGGPMPRMLALVADAVQGADTVLEVAAGTGLVTVAIAPRVREVIATDYSESMIGELRRRVAEAGLLNVTCSQGDVYALPYGPGTFDLVVAANVLHLLPDLPRALEVLRGLLRPGGRLVVPTFCHVRHCARRSYRASSLSRAFLRIVGLLRGRCTTR
jgi:phosphatidylethanolamine/phosphatidyl-N-methylethanolamine N-methyltransferase